jgi:hypothetical protein
VGNHGAWFVLDVTAADIRNADRCYRANGGRSQADSCPIAWAARRAGLVAPRFRGGVLQAIGGRWYAVGLNAAAFASRFDNGRLVEPASFRFRRV